MSFNWISNKTDKCFYARKEFFAEKEIKSATALVTGLGQFNFYINDKKADDHVLDPAWTNYNKLIQYVSIDVTDLIRKGANAIGIEVGNGWYIRDNEGYIMKYPSFKEPVAEPYKPFAKYLTCAAVLIVEYADETQETIVTDESWKTAVHPTFVSNVYGTEYMDGKLVQDGWASSGFDDSGWTYAQILDEEDEPKGELQQAYQPPVSVKKVYKAELIHEHNGNRVYDLGQNMSGMLHFAVKGRAGERIDVMPAEKLAADGGVDQMAKGWNVIDVKESYIIAQSDKWEQFSMHFTYFAGRYLEFSGNAEIKDVEADFITNASADTGYFRCSDKRYEQVYDLVKKAVECNLLSVHTDCPTIERFAWQEPNHLMAPSIMYMKNVDLLWKKFLTDMRIDQIEEGEGYSNGNGEVVCLGEGLIPAQAPRWETNAKPSKYLGSFFDIIPWGSAGVLGAWWHYMFYGNEDIIRENFDMGLKYLKHLKGKMTPEGFINHGLGDWGNPDRKLLARENIETAFLYADAKILSQMAAVLHLPEKEKELADFAQQVRENYNEKLMVIHPEYQKWCYRIWEYGDENVLSQAAQALPLFWGMVDDEKTDDVAAVFREVLKKDDSFISGEVGMPYIIQAMCRYGMNDMICDFMMREEHPSYYAFVKEGETTLGEYWETNPRSHCHDMMGHIAEWYFNGIAGIIPEEPGFKTAVIRPYLPKTMDEFACSYNSAAGMISVEVKKTAGKVSVNVQTGVPYKLDTSALRLQGFEVC